MMVPTHKRKFHEELPDLLAEIENVLPRGDSHVIDGVLKRLTKYSGLDNSQQRIVRNFEVALRMRGELSGSSIQYLMDVKRGPTLGDGSFSNVYKGMWNGKEVAVKRFHSVVPPHHIDGTFKADFEQQVKPAVSFRRELNNWKMVSGLDSVWPLLGFTMLLDRDEMRIDYALVSPVAEGYLKLNYTDWLYLTPGKFATYFHDVATGLKSVHSAGLIHGDIRPENILRNKGRYYLVDFGISKHFNSSSPFTFAPAVPNAGIPKLPDGSVIGRNRNTDIFLLGTAMYQILTRETLDIANGQLEPERPESRLGQEWDAIWNLILRCICEAHSGHPTAAELVASLKAILKAFPDVSVHAFRSAVTFDPLRFRARCTIL